jgi:hypothetical protein
VNTKSPHILIFFGDKNTEEINKALTGELELEAGDMSCLKQATSMDMLMPDHQLVGSSSNRVNGMRRGFGLLNCSFCF